jgi:hypothetical protein
VRWNLARKKTSRLKRSSFIFRKWSYETSQARAKSIAARRASRMGKTAAFVEPTVREPDYYGFPDIHCQKIEEKSTKHTTHYRGRESLSELPCCAIRYRRIMGTFDDPGIIAGIGGLIRETEAAILALHPNQRLKPILSP